jgi:hypothetical protein
MRGKAHGTGGVFFVNLLLGWTVVGWFKDSFGNYIVIPARRHKGKIHD